MATKGCNPVVETLVQLVTIFLQVEVLDLSTVSQNYTSKRRKILSEGQRKLTGSKESSIDFKFKKLILVNITLYHSI